MIGKGRSGSLSISLACLCACSVKLVSVDKDEGEDEAPSTGGGCDDHHDGCDPSGFCHPAQFELEGPATCVGFYGGTHDDPI